MGRTRISAVKAKSGQEICTRMITTPSPHRRPSVSAFVVKYPVLNPQADSSLRGQVSCLQKERDSQRLNVISEGQ